MISANIHPKQTALTGTLALVLGGLSPMQASAALPANAILEFDDGFKTCAIGGTYPSCTYGVTSTSGSYFSMDADGSGSVSDSEKTPIAMNEGITLGIAQPTSGESHSGAPTGTENTSIDMAWGFFGNTGMHNTISAITITGNVTLDFSGWRVDWNGIEDINMGGDSANFASDTGLATMTCAVDCSAGDTFVLDYAAHVPLGDASGFGGVPYTLHLEGTISIPPTPSALGDESLADGDFGGTLATSYKIASPADDSGFVHVGGIFDFKVSCGTPASGCSAQVVVPLTADIPADASYRKYSAALGWQAFDDSGADAVASTASVAGSCSTTPADYTAGLTEGDDCVLLTLVDGGLNDADGAADGTITDPGGVARPESAAFVADLSSGSSGCTVSGNRSAFREHMEWLLLGGLLAGLGLSRRRSS